MSTLLITGFEPFGDWDVNPTEVAVRHLDGFTMHETEIVGRVIPLRFLEIQPLLSELVTYYEPDMIVMTGQAGGDAIRLERNAHNIAKSRIPYNCGTMTTGGVLEEEGASVLHSTLPLEPYYQRLVSAGIPVKYSETAGLFGCNQIFYHGRHDYPDIPSGFIHVPLLPSQVKDAGPSMEQATITSALQLICEESAKFLIM